MRIYRFLLPALLCIAHHNTSLASDDVGKAAAPDWAETLPLRPFSKDRSTQFRGGIAHLLNDTQVRKSPGGYEYVERYVIEVVDRTGLEEAARITHSFDPSSETLNFDSVRILRNDDVLDRLTDAEITIIRQEQRLERNLIDGELTALVELEDVRVGDVIDVVVSGDVELKLWPDEFFWATQVEWAVPLAQMRFRLTIPDDLPVNTRSVATDTEPGVSLLDGMQEFTLHVLDPDPVRLEQHLPEDYMTFGLVAFTTMDRWSDIVDWATPLFTFDDKLPPDLVERLDTISATYERPEDRAMHAVRMVQDEIRYLGIEIDLGSHVPRPPEVTLERGYGDCKDKSVLLVSALSYLGIDANPVLASISNGAILPKLPPSLNAFDHVIVEFDIGGTTYRVDPTLTHQGGDIDGLADLDYGYVLPIQPGQTDLIELDVRLPEEPPYEVVQTFDFGSTDEDGLSIEVEHIYRDTYANHRRWSVANSGHEDMRLGFLDYYAYLYEGIVEDRPLEISDDRDSNTVVIRGRYSIDAGKLQESGYAESLPVYATTIQDELPRKIEANRIAPLALSYGLNLRHTVRIIGGGDLRPLPNDTTRFINGVTYSRAFDQRGEVLTIVYSLQIGEEEVELAATGDVLDLAEKIAQDSEITVNLDSPAPSMAEQLGLDVEIDPATEAALNRIEDRVDDEEYVEALTGLNTLLKRHSEPTGLHGYLHLQRAVVLVELARRKAAIRSFAKAFELYRPPAPGDYFTYLNVLRKEERYEDTVRVMGLLFERHPEAIARVNTEWLTSFWRVLAAEEITEARDRTARDRMARVLAGAVRAYDVRNVDDFQWYVLHSVELLSEEGNAEEASAYLPYIRNPTAFAGLLANRKYQAVWEAVEAHAGEDLSIAIGDYVGYTELAANRAPEDFQALTLHLTALRIAQRHQQAVRFAGLFLDNWSRIEAVGKDAFWFVNAAAYALSDAGRKDEALDLMDKLVGLGVADNGELISMAINRAQLLMHWGEFQAALDAAEELEQLGDGYASEYGWMWVFDAKACSLHQLGRRDEARTVLQDSILPIADRNRSAHTKTLLCLDDQDAAAEQIIDRLRDPQELDMSLLPSFYQFASPAAGAPFLAELESRGDAVRTRHDVTEAFEKVGRSIAIDGSRNYWGEF